MNRIADWDGLAKTKPDIFVPACQNNHDIFLNSVTKSHYNLSTILSAVKIVGYSSERVSLNSCFYQQIYLYLCVLKEC
jgi:hypothetical protein